MRALSPRYTSARRRLVPPGALLMLVGLTTTRHHAFAAPLPVASKQPAASSATLPLYAGLETADRSFYVEALVGDEPLLLRIDSASSELHLAPGAVERLGFAERSVTGRPNLRLAAVRFGDVVLSGVRAWADDAPDARYGVDGSVGLLAFPGVSWAVLPSQGTVLLAPNDQGPALLAAVGGTPAPQVNAAELRSRTVRVGERHVQVRADFVQLPVPFSGVTIPAAWQTAGDRTWVAQELERPEYALGARPCAQPPAEPTALPAADGWQDSTGWVEGRDVLGTPASVRRPALGSASVALPLAGVGIDVAQRFDLAVDNGNHLATVAAANALLKADYGDRLELRLRGALVPDDGTPAGRAAHDGALSEYATFLEHRARAGDAATVRSALTLTRQGDCATWLAYGDDLVRAGRPADALLALEKARSLYETWAARPLAERRAAESDGAGDRAGDARGPQPSACFVAAGHLAAARLATGDLAGVEALYRGLDLDPGVARAGALAALRAGDVATAEARFRQALALDAPGADDAARIGLFVTLAPTRPELAAAQLEAAHFRYDGATDALVLARWADLRRPGGHVVEDLRALASAAPGDPVLLAQLTRELRGGGATGDEVGAAARAALAAFDAALASTPRDGRLWADYALFLVSEQRLDEARKADDLARVFAPGCGDTWLAASAIRVGRADWTPAATANGDPDLARAAAAGVDNPAYAALAR